MTVYMPPSPRPQILQIPHSCARTDEVSRWLVEAAAQLTASGRAGVAAAGAAGSREREALGRLSDDLEAAVGALAAEHDTFMRRHAIKVETQVRERGGRGAGPGGA